MGTVSGWANLLGGGGSSSITAHYLTEFIVTRIMGQFWPYILALSFLDIYFIIETQCDVSQFLYVSHITCEPWRIGTEGLTIRHTHTHI